MTPRYRRCLDCPAIIERQHSRCDDCRAARERTRGTRTQRGYGTEHQAAKLRLRAEGHTHCQRCGRPFTEANPMETGHVTALRYGGTGVDGHAPHCMECNRGWRRTGL